MLKRLISAIIAFACKIFAHTFYTVEEKWVDGSDKKAWKDVRLFVFLNHTSLFEFLFFNTFPFHFLWRGSKNVVIPGADKTMNRPIAGRFFKYLTPKTVSISRKRDNTWNQFLEEINEESIIVILPEGRMLRPNGLDASGKPMSVRGGIADILQMLDHGTMMIAYSGGLHHVQKPGQTLPKFFKKIKITYESLKIEDYKKKFDQNDHRRFKIQVIEDLQTRKDQHC